MKKDKHFVEERLTYLYSLKSELIPSQRERQKKYKGERVNPKHPTKSDYITNTEFSIINAKRSEILSGLQEYDFIPLDDEGITYTHLVKRVWDYEWLASKTDKHLGRAVFSALVNGDGFIYEGTRKIVRKIQEPQIINGEVEFRENEVVEYDGVYTEYIPWENIYFDGSNIDDANEAIWIKDWDRDDFLNSFKDNPKYSNVNSEIPIGRHYYSSQDMRSVRLDADLKSADIITELRYYNKSKDLFIVLANGVEVLNTHIPYPHKELPFCKFEDYPLMDRFYSMGEYELLEEDVRFKDALRSLSIDVIKAQMGFTVIDPDADFDEATVEIGTNKFARVAPNQISHFSPNINANSIIQAEQNIDNDIIIKSGIDYRAQILGPSETATKTSAKTQSARKRINLNLKLNGYTFFERLARLRMANLRLLYSTERKIPLKGGSINKKGVYSPLNGGYGSFIVKPEYLKGKFNLIPITESILGVSNERNKQNFLNFMEIAGNMVGTDGKPVFNPDKLAEELAYKWEVDFNKLTEQSPAFKSPEDLIKEAESRMNGTSMDASNPMSAEYIPPEQRSGSKMNIPTLGGGMSNIE